MRKENLVLIAALALLCGCASTNVYKIADNKYKMECRDSFAGCENQAREVCPLASFTVEDKQEEKRTLVMQDGSTREMVIYTAIIKCN